jgi:membrane associated rhomboid family serine protease
MRITFNAPFVLIFVLISVLCLILQTTLGSPLRINVLLSEFQADDWQVYISFIGHSLGHDNTGHLIGNLSIILLIGPAIEKEHGSWTFFFYCLITSLAISIVHVLFWNHNLMGASGLVFMMIVLLSLSGRKNGEVPMTFILIVLLFVGQEVLNAFKDDQVSQFAHIFGGAIGMIFGYFPLRKI